MNNSWVSLTHNTHTHTTYVQSKGVKPPPANLQSREHYQGASAEEEGVEGSTASSSLHAVTRSSTSLTQSWQMFLRFEHTTYRVLGGSRGWERGLGREHDCYHVAGWVSVSPEVSSLCELYTANPAFQRHSCRRSRTEDWFLICGEFFSAGFCGFLFW